MNRIITFGCRLNAFESEIIRQRMERAGLDGVLLLHTCAVTAEAERQARQALRRAILENPGAKIVVAGCSAQGNAAEFAKIEGVFAVLGNAEKLRQECYDKLASPPPGRPPFVFVGDPAGAKAGETLPAAGMFDFKDKTKAFVQIQQGCDNRCSFCVVPLLRGRSRSLDEDSVLAETAAFIRRGYKEIVLTGVDISAYGADARSGSLFGITKRILEENPGLQRLRLSSLDPARNYDQILGLMKEDLRLMPHLHLSLQSCDDRVLREMRRRHSVSDVLELVKKIRRTSKHIAIGADVIAGFPGETEKEFRNTCAVIRKCGISHLHVFPYSKRAGTRAAGLPGQLPQKVKKARAAELRELGMMLKMKFIRGEKGRPHDVLVEKSNRGYTENYILVEIEGPPIPPNTIVKAKIAKISAEGKVTAKRV